MSYKYLTTRRDGAVEYLTLNRPEVRNAFNDEMIAELTAWAERHRRDGREPARGRAGRRGQVVLRRRRRRVDGEDDRLLAKPRTCATRRPLSRMFRAIDTLPVPVIGRVHGAALGGGAGLAAVCDIVVADEDAVFGFTEVKLGHPAGGDLAVRARQDRPVGGARAVPDRRALLGGARARDRPGARRRAAGGARRDRLDATSRRSLAAAPKPIAAAKALIRDVSGPRRPSAASPSPPSAIAARRVSPEGQEGLKRVPREAHASLDRAMIRARC